MIKVSALGKACAISVAVTVHVIAVAVFFTGDSVQMEGAAGGRESSVGSSFAELATGVLETTVAPEITPEMPVPPVVTSNSGQTLASEVPVSAAVEPVWDVQQADVQSADGAEALATPLAAPMAAEEPMMPLQISSDSVVAKLASVSPTKSLDGMTQSAAAVTRSLRPKPRSADFETAHKRAAPKRDTAAKPARVKTQPTASRNTAAPKGNADRNARVGTADGARKTGKTVASGAGKKTPGGTARADNYPGQVMTRISRVPRPRVGDKGTAVVAFRIAANGGLAGVSVARSSGSARLDQAAVTVIRRAAPFPPPPPGARRSFSINVKGR